MYKTLSTRLAALFNPDGGHLHRYLQRKPTITKSLCEDLILHDQVLVPTQDFLTACGLILLLGENNFIELLERDKLKFVRTPGVLGFVRGTGLDGGLAVFSDPNNQRPQDAPLEQSVDAGLSVIEDRIKEKRKLHDRIVESCSSIEWAAILEAVRRESITDLKHTALWKPEYELTNPDLLALPGMEEMQVRVIGPGHDPIRNVVDTFLALVLYNSELYLAEGYDCQNTSPFFPIGDLLDRKGRRLANDDRGAGKLWTLLEINGIPDLSSIDFAQGSTFSDLLKVCSSKNAETFRCWFQEKQNLSEKEVLAEYVGLLKQISWIERLPAKVLRFAVTTGFGFVPGLGHAVSIFDTFVVDRLFRRRSPKFFIDDLTKVSGNLQL